MAPSTKKPTKRRSRPKMLIDDVTAILLISPHAKELCSFYRATLGLPLEEERHEGMPLHYGCSLGAVHFAIHRAEEWPGSRPARSPVICFSTSKLEAVVDRLTSRGVKVTGPADHGFARVASFRDPDGNHVSILEYGQESW